MVKVNLTDEDLAERKNNNYFEPGVHEVVITKAERGVTDNGKEYVEFTVLGHNDESDTARLWFTTDNAAKYALSILAGIAVHNRENEADKQKVRDAYKKITDTDQVNDAFLQKFVDMDAWFSVAVSDRTYTNSAGETKHSYDKNIYGYEPKVKAPTAAELVADFKSKGTNVDPDEVPFE